ncbi:hypothetical protein O181_090550 [Austropuccinia psidii MF-1]|uniref:Uncharacterized protein n=1 Tax=Austropuccinia psidii MF-1 TaxID=1389203 RepID=A0A9Q3P772_9BASI|nr:hypothetical protein [Austropuccinia psidii MF-1]
MHQLASATVSNHLCQWPMLLTLYPRHASTPTIADLKALTLTLPHACAIVSTPYHAYTHKICVPPPPHVRTQTSLCFHTPSSFFLLLTMIMLPLRPIDMCPLDHPYTSTRRLILSTIYHAYTPTVPSIYYSAPATPPLTMLILPAAP